MSCVAVSYCSHSPSKYSSPAWPGADRVAVSVRLLDEREREAELEEIPAMLRSNQPSSDGRHGLRLTMTITIHGSKKCTADLRFCETPLRSDPAKQEHNEN